MVKYIIYGTQTCKYCDMAKNLLEESGFEYEYRAIDLVPEHFSGLRSALPTAKTVPQVFKVVKHATIYVGGYEELKESLK